MICIMNKDEFSPPSIFKDIQCLLESDETLCDRIAKETHLSYDEVKLLSLELVKFLIIKCTYQDEYILPSQLIDIAWHQFIIHTKLYSDFCQKNFHRYIHHRPLNNNPPFENTLKYMRKVFGTNINMRYWQKSA